MTTSIRRFSISCVALAACFGGGPAPSFDTEATAVFVIPPQPQQCNGMWQYFGGVAFTAGSPVGYTAELPWGGPDCDSSSGGGGGPSGAEVDILEFGGTSGSASRAGTKLGSAGTISGNGGPRMAVDLATGTLAYAFSNTNNGGQGPPDIDVVVVQPGGPPTTLGPQGVGLAAATGNLNVEAVVVDSGAAWLAVSVLSNGFQPDLDNPTFPCCSSALGETTAGSLWRVGYGSGGLTSSELTGAMSFPSSLPEALVGNSTTLFFVSRTTGPEIAELGAFPKSGGSDADRVHLASLDTSVAPDVVPVGLAADDHHVAWAASLVSGISPDGPVGCWISAVDLAAPLGSVQAQPLFSSTTFSCMSLAIDATAVYFAIVSTDHKQNNMHGEGIGRVSFADGTFESIAVGMAGTYAGPRRVYAFAGSDDALYAIDPMAIGLLRKGFLDGRHDF